MTFLYPQIFLLGILFLWPLLRVKKTASTLAVPSSELLSQSPRSIKQTIRRPLLLTLRTALIASILAAAARPQEIKTILPPDQARNIILSIDVSPSMETDDFISSQGYGQRIEGVRRVVSEYVRARAGDRVGLVVFAGRAYLQAPLTSDVTLVSRLVEQLRAGMAGDGTAIGDGLGLAMKRMRDVPGDSKAIILLTDGVQTAGAINPLSAAKVAKDLGIKVHTVGVGSTKEEPVGFPFMNQPKAEFDEALLRQVAATTGGVYFNASSIADLSKVYAEIERLETSEIKTAPKQIVHEYSWYFVLIAFCSYLLLLALFNTVLARYP